jgi:hypothetical protein
MVTEAMPHRVFQRRLRQCQVPPARDLAILPCRRVPLPVGFRTSVAEHRRKFWPASNQVGDVCGDKWRALDLIRRLCRRRRPSAVIRPLWQGSIHVDRPAVLVMDRLGDHKSVGRLRRSIRHGPTVQGEKWSLSSSAFARHRPPFARGEFRAMGYDELEPDTCELSVSLVALV